MATKSNFSALLDDLPTIGSMEYSPASAARATIPFDYLAVADELHSGRIRVAADVSSNYAQLDDEDDAGAADELLTQFESIAIEADTPVLDEPLPPMEPEAVAAELDLSGASDLHRVRRRFAFANHPDRVAPHLRERAVARMQVANMLIDAAARRAATR